MTFAWLASVALASSWRLQEDLVVQVRPPVPVGWLDGRTTLTWAVEWEPGDPTFRARLCAVEVSPMLGAVTTWPDAALAAVPEVVRPVDYAGGHWVAGPVVDTIGDGDDDGDGNPGLSLHVEHPRAGSGDVFVRQSATLAWDGTLAEDGAIRGTMTYEPDQEMLGATTWWLRMGISQRPHRKEPSTFVLSPTDRQGCG